jgi:dolichyl-diphosphooligosaccharide--protein glycosyltransferase
MSETVARASGPDAKKDAKKREEGRPRFFSPFGMRVVLLALLAFVMTFALRMLEWPSWQNPEYRLGREWLLATHDAYHWVAGAEGFEFGAGHPMSEILRLAAELSGLPPALPAFWLPPVFAGFTAVLVFAWVWALGSAESGLCAALLCSLAPGHLARTLLGYYDTDLVTLCFPLLISLMPALWATRFLRRPFLARRASPGRGLAVFLGFDPEEGPPGPVRAGEKEAFSPLWTIALALSGFLADQAVAWHSVFPYLGRYNALLICLLSLLLAPSGLRPRMLLGAFAYALPALAGPWGLLFPLAVCLAPALPRPTPSATAVPEEDGLPRDAASMPPLVRFLCRPAVLCLPALLTAYFLLSADVLDSLLGHVAAYVKQPTDMKTDAGGVQLTFPAVAQSIIEVQDLTLAEALFYFHPWAPVSALGLAGFLPVMLRRPGALFLLPLGALGLLSMKMGGRMVMFGAPVMALGLTLPVVWTARWLLRSEMRGFWSGFVVSLALLACLGAPVAELIPAMSSGPVLNRRHAEGLVRARNITPEDSVLWLWWDWGYAAHHFARRRVIADGAMHGGPSLYLPAAVFASDNPRFSRQIIKYAALKNNEPGGFFAGLDNSGAAELMRRLRSPATPPVQAPGRQYVIVNFEMLRLGFWVTYFGSWDFLSQTGTGSAIGILSQQLTYQLEDGEVLVQGAEGSISTSTINVFEDGKFSRRNYILEWLEKNPNAGDDARRRFFEKRRNVHFLLNRVTDEKLVVDEKLYNSLMVRLLVAPPGDPSLSEHFRLVYDNVFCRVYEVL